MKWGGLAIAEGVVTAFLEESRAPCFVTATTRHTEEGEKNQNVAGLYWVVAYVYNPAMPNRVVALGLWAVGAQTRRRNFSSPRHAPPKIHSGEQNNQTKKIE